MLRDITIGQYYQINSKIHRLDPRVKLFATFLYIIMLFVCNDLIGYGISAVCLLAVIIVSRIPFRYIFRGIKAILVLLFISVFFNLFFTPGRVIFQVYFVKITYEGMIKTIQLAIRFVLIIISSSMLTLTTTPTDLTDGLEKSLGFLNYIKVPVHDIAMMMSIALRFIPILMQEADKIIKAQTARGADFESGTVIRRAKAMIPIMIPLFVSAFKRASDLAVAMDARCYIGGKGRTKMHPLQYKGADYVAYMIIFLFMAIMIAQKIYLVYGL